MSFFCIPWVNKVLPPLSSYASQYAATFLSCSCCRLSSEHHRLANNQLPCWGVFAGARPLSSSSQYFGDKSCADSKRTHIRKPLGWQDDGKSRLHTISTGVQMLSCARVECPHLRYDRTDLNLNHSRLAIRAAAAQWLVDFRSGVTVKSILFALSESFAENTLCSCDTEDSRPSPAFKGSTNLQHYPFGSWGLLEPQTLPTSFSNLVYSNY